MTPSFANFKDADMPAPGVVKGLGSGMVAINADPYTGATAATSTDSEFTKGLNSAIVGGSGLFGDGASALMNEALKAYADGDEATGRLLETQALELAKSAQANGPRVQDVRDVQGLGDGLDWAAGALGSGVASMGQSIVGGLAGAGAGALVAGPAGAAAGGLAGAFGAGYGPAVDEQSMKSMTDKAVRDTRSAEDILQMNRLAGAGSAALDSVGAGVTAVGRKVLGRAVTGEGKDALRKIGEEVRDKGAARYVAGRTGESMLAEGATGGAQSVIGQVAQNELAGREGIDLGDVAADAAAEAVGGSMGAAPAVVQAGAGYLASRPEAPKKTTQDRIVALGQKAGEAGEAALNTVETALARAVKPTEADPDFFNISQPVDQALGNDEVIAAGEAKVQAAQRLAAKLVSNKAASEDEKRAAVQFEADMQNGDPDTAVANLRSNLDTVYRKAESKKSVLSALNPFSSGKSKANAMEPMPDGPDTLDDVMSIWQEKAFEGDSAFKDVMDDPEVLTARRGFAQWVMNDFRDQDNGKLFIPQGMAEALGGKVKDAVLEAFNLLRQQGLVADTPEREASAQRMAAALGKLGERNDTSLKMLKDSFTPVALRDIGPANLDKTATQVQTVMARLARGEIEMSDAGMKGLVELFGTKARVKGLLKNFQQGRASKADEVINDEGFEDGGYDEDGEFIGAGEDQSGDIAEPLTRTFSGPFDSKDSESGRKIKAVTDRLVGANPKAKVRQVGLWDKLRLENADPDDLFKAEYDALTERGVTPASIDDPATRTRLLTRLNKTVKFVVEEVIDDSDGLDKIELNNFREKRPGGGYGTPDTASNGRLYLEREKEVEVDDPDAEPTITPEGEIVPKKKKEKQRSMLLTSTSKLLAHANRAKLVMVEETDGAKRVADKTLAALSALLASGNDFTGRLGVKSEVDGEVKWFGFDQLAQKGDKQLPQELLLLKSNLTTLKDAGYTSVPSKKARQATAKEKQNSFADDGFGNLVLTRTNNPPPTWINETKRSDLAELGEAEIEQWLESKREQLAFAKDADRKMMLRDDISAAEEAIEGRFKPTESIDDITTRDVRGTRLEREELPEKPVKRDKATGEVAVPAPTGKLATGMSANDLFRPMVGKKASRKQVAWLIDALRKGVPALAAAIKALPADRAATARAALFELSSMDPRDSRLTGLLKDFAEFQKRISAALRELSLERPTPAKLNKEQKLPEPIMGAFQKEASALLPELQKLVEQMAGLDSATGAESAVKTQVDKLKAYLSAGTPPSTPSAPFLKMARQLTELAREKGLREQAAKIEARIEKVSKPAPTTKSEFLRKLVEASSKERLATLKKLSDEQLDALDTYIDGILKDPNETEFEGVRDKLIRFQLDEVYDEFNTREDAAVKANAQKEDTDGASEQTQAEVKAELLATLGDKVKVLFEKKVIVNGKRVSGSWTEKDGESVIRIAVRALDPIGVGRHEAMHQLFRWMNKSGVTEMREVLERAASNQIVHGRMRRLLQDHPAALKQLSDPEEAAAYMYQFWSARKSNGERLLDIGPRTETFFQKVANFIREVTGLVKQEVRDARHAEQIMQAFAEGQMSTDPDASLQVINESLRADMAKAEKNLLTALNNNKVLKNFVYTADGVMRDTKNPYMIKLADMLSTPEGGKVGQQSSYFDAVPAERAKWLNKLNDIFREVEPEDATLVMQALQAETPINKINDKVIADTVKRVRAYLDDMHDYMVTRNVQRFNEENETWEPIPKIKKNYFPRVWDVDQLMTEERGLEFMALLKEHHSEHLQFVADQHGTTQDEVATAILKKIVEAAGADDHTESTTSLGITPFQQALNKRSLNWIDPEIFEPFMSKDLSKILTGYTVQAVKRAEYTSRFGNQGEKIQQMFDDALRHEVSKSNEQLTDRMDRAFTAAQRTWAEKKREGVDPGPFPTYRSVAITLFSNEAALADALKMLAAPIKVVMAAEGTLGSNISDNKRKAFGYVTTYQNFRLLALSLFASFVDPMGIIVRGGTINEAYQAFTYGIRELVKGWKGQVSQDEAAKIAERMGTVDAGTFMDALGQMHASQFMDAKMRRLNDKLFKWNGMEAWNRAMRIQGTQAAIGFIERHLTKPGKHSERYLKDELGLTGDEGSYMKGGKLDLDNELVRQAVVRWVNGAILRPNAMQRPIMASDPHYQLFYHLKQFTYSFHKVILQRAYTEAKAGNYTPTAALFAGYVPVAIAADVIKELLVPGDEPPWMKSGLGEVVRHGVSRANLLGIPQMGLDNLSFAANRGNPLELSGLLGPAPDQVIDWLMVPLTEAHAAGGELMRALPATGVVSRASTLVD
jgi:hypothetical protein